jgi:hypothetical protein
LAGWNPSGFSLWHTGERRRHGAIRVEQRSPPFAQAAMTLSPGTRLGPCEIAFGTSRIRIVPPLIFAGRRSHPNANAMGFEQE